MTEMLTETINVEETQLTEFLPSEILDLAADLIESAGWSAKAACLNGKYCAGGAVAQLAVADPSEMYVSDAKFDEVVDPKLLASLTYLQRAIGGTSTFAPDVDIYDYNDDPNRTKDEVVAKLHEAADLARQSGE